MIGDINLSLKCYFKDLKSFNTINGDDQIELAIKAKSGDEKALHRLVESNLRFVVTIAKEYQYSNIPLEDLISEGNFGLIKAVDKYDPTKNIRFISYAVWWVRQSILQSIYENDSIVRLPINRISINNKVNKTKDVLTKQLGREPTSKEISDFCNVCEIDILNSYTDCSKPIEFHMDDNDDNGINFCDLFQSDDVDSVEKKFSRKETTNSVNNILNELSERESKILKMFFGMDTGEPMNLREIGEKMSLTNERVRQIKDFALKKLRTFKKSQKLRKLMENEI